MRNCVWNVIKAKKWSCCSSGSWDIWLLHFGQRCSPITVEIISTDHHASSQTNEGGQCDLVETPIIWGRTDACNGKLLWYYIWNVCGLGNWNLQQQRYVGLMTSGISRNVFRWTGQRPLRWRDRMRSGDGRRCSVFVSVCLSQDGRSNHMLCLS